MDFMSQCLIFITAAFFGVLILLIFTVLIQAFLKRKDKQAATKRGKKNNKAKAKFIKIAIREFQKEK